MDSIDKKKNIYYARTYRRLQINIGLSLIFAGILIIPSIILLVLNMDNITEYICRLGTEVLSKLIPADIIQTKTTDYSIINSMKYIELPTFYPSDSIIIWNLISCLILIILLQFIQKKGRPLVTFLLFAIVIHVVSCAYFCFELGKFPYTLGVYSDLYIKQQIGTWLAFIILAGMVVSFVGEKGYLYKLVTYVGIMAYSIVFGTVRYILYLFLLYKYSVLYMALLFFVVGPMFDFAYFVGIYAAFVNKITKDYELGKKKGAWKWS